MKKLLPIVLVVSTLICLLGVTAYAAEDVLTYTPYYGFSYYYTSNSERYARINVKWNRAGITEFNSYNDTYEQELVFYNYDNTAYATTCSAYQTNIPNAYLDTQLFDDGNESNLAIGTTSADEIEPETAYYYIYNLKGSNGTESMYKIGSQEGQYLFLIQSTYTTFAQSTTYLIPFKSGYTAPETRGWYTEVENNDTVEKADIRYLSKWLSGVISDENDVDYVKMYLSGQKTIRFISPSGNDYDVAIYDESGTNIIGLYSMSTEQTRTYTFTEGYYYFKIYPYTGSSATDVYRMIVE